MSTDDWRAVWIAVMLVAPFLMFGLYVLAQ